MIGVALFMQYYMLLESKVFQGSGECAEVQWSLFGLSIPEWALIGFIFFCLYGLKVLIKGR